MASDSLIFRILSYVLPKFKTPVVAIVTCGLLTAILALIFDLEELVNLTSIGTLLAYSLVSACNLTLRYRPFVFEDKQDYSEKESVIYYIFGLVEDKAVLILFC